MATGEDCSDPIVIGALPYSHIGQTSCGMVADYNDSCQSYDNDEDVIYALTVTDGMCIDFTLTGATSSSWPLVVIDDDCGVDGFDPCLYNAYSSTVHTGTYTFATAGTYYIMVDSDNGGCFDYDFVITECPTFGACCHPDGSCTDEAAEGDCTGVFQGTGTECATTSCPQPCTYKATATIAPGMADYVDTNTNCGDGDNYSDTCLGSYDSGEDAIYEFNVTAETCVNITLTSDTTYTGIAIDDICPLDAGTSDCIEKSTGSGTDQAINNLVLAAGSYYLMLDTYASPDCINDYTLTVSECPAGGACCHDGGACTDEADEAACTTAGGTWEGPGTDCASTTCPQPPPANDECTGAYLVDTLPYSHTTPMASIIWATPEANVDVSCDSSYGCGSDEGWGVWYTYTPAEDCTASLAESGSMDSSTSVWSGADCDTLTEVNCSDPETSEVVMTAGTQYWVLISKWSCSAAPDEDVIFDFDCVPIPDGGACCHPDGSCTDELVEGDCTTAGGIYEGDGTECATTDCPQPPEPGDNCANPLIVNIPGDLPYFTSDTTVDRGDDYSDTCMGSYDGAEDIIYQLNVAADTCVNISLDADNTWAGMAVDDVCPLDGTCIATAISSADPDEINLLTLTAGTYYLMADIYPSPDTFNFDLSITECPTGGACCHPDGSCTDEASEGDCTAAGGVYEGDGSECATTDCPQPPPANDECTGKTIVYDGTTAFTFVGALDSEPTPSCLDGDTFTTIYKDVWFNYTATCSGLLTVQTCDADTIQDTKLMIYDGCTCPDSSMDAMYCADDGCGSGYESFAQFTVTDGNCYKIRAGLYGSSTMPDDLGAALNIQCEADLSGACCEAGGGCTDGVEEAACTGTFMGVGTTCATVTCPPANDTCESATVMSCGTPATVLVGETTEGATNDYDGASCSGYATASPDVVYEFTLASPKILTVIMDATVAAGYSGWDNAMYIVTDCADIAGTCVVGSDYSTNGMEGGTTASALPAGTYYLICDGWGGEAGGFDLTLGCEDPPATGACCVSGACTDDVLEGDCAGTWYGGQLCADTTCPPINDDCAGKLMIVEGTTEFDTTSATTDGPAQPGSDCDVYGNDQVWDDIWYNFTATCDGTLTVDTCLGAEADDTRVAIYDGCTCPVTTDDLLICNDDAAGACPAGSYMSMASTAVTDGSCYKIRVGNYSPGGEASGLINVELACYTCGDGDINVAGEECDDGNTADGDGCSSTCIVEFCGDGTVNNVDEECDDSNTIDGDGCSATCVTEFCGDAIVNNVDEECDDGNDIDTDACIDCEDAECGDGYVWIGVEECDDSGESYGCDLDCTDAFCGDGTVNATRGEECDTGGMSATCDADCTAPVCGDGVLNPLAGEMCDDGNNEPLDGCSVGCKIEAPIPAPVVSPWGMLAIVLSLCVGISLKMRRRTA